MTNALKWLFRVLFPFKWSYKVIFLPKASYLMVKMENFQIFHQKFHFDFGMISKFDDTVIASISVRMIQSILSIELNVKMCLIVYSIFVI